MFRVCMRCPGWVNSGGISAAKVKHTPGVETGPPVANDRATEERRHGRGAMWELLSKPSSGSGGIESKSMCPYPCNGDTVLTGEWILKCRRVESCSRFAGKKGES
jgi:hypothetical protein